MMNSTAERLQEALKEKGWDQTDLADKVGATQGAISKILVGKTQNSRLMPRIATVLDKPMAWLLCETDDPTAGLAEGRLPFKGEAPEIRDDVVEIDEINIAFGLGGSYLDEPPVSEKVPFPRKLLERYSHSSPDKIFAAIGIGDSMYPTIHDRDLVFVDRGQTTPRMKDQIWALVQGEIGMIKRVRPMPDGSLVLLSDNPQVPEEIAYDGEVHVIGRVVAVLKNL